MMGRQVDGVRSDSKRTFVSSVPLGMLLNLPVLRPPRL